MTAASVFTADACLELMDGEIIEMAPIGSRHAAVVNTLMGMMVRSAGDRVIVSAQNPVIVGEQSVPQPDLAVLKLRPDRYFNAHPTAAAVLLVIEVADTSLRFDLDRKIPLYGRAGVAEAWLIDLDKRVLHLFSTPDPDIGYRIKSIASGPQVVCPAALPDVSIAMMDIFPT